MDAEKALDVVIEPLGPGGAGLGMTRAEIWDQINHVESTINIAVEFQTQIIFGWLVAMFFVAHRLSGPQMFMAYVFFILINLMNLTNLVSGILRVKYWGELESTPNVTAASQTMDFTDWLILATSAHWFQITLILSIYVACIWWAFSCRKNQPNEIGSPI